MKRSEMIEAIAENVFRDHPESDLEAADRILDVIEKMGMLPPPLDGTVKLVDNQDGTLSIPLWGWEVEGSK